MEYQGETSIIPNGVDVTRFAHVEHRVFDISGEVTLVTTSRLVHKNAIDDVIRALAFLPDSTHFSIYGIGPDENELKALTKNLDVERRVEFKGFINHSELPRVLSECSIFIRPSRSEGMGISFVESMAADLPVIATQEGGIADFLFDAKRNPGKETTGWAVDRDSPEQIAEAVKEILENPEQVARVTAAAKKLVSENYDWDIIAGQDENALRPPVRETLEYTHEARHCGTSLYQPRSAARRPMQRFSRKDCRPRALRFNW